MLRLTSKLVVLTTLLTSIGALTGCNSEDEPEFTTNGKADEITISQPGTVSTIRFNDAYHLIVTSDNNKLNLENNISEITIIGSGNQLTVKDDDFISTINIMGSDNIVFDEAGYKLTQLITSGDNNEVYGSTHETWSDSGKDNSIHMKDEDDKDTTIKISDSGTTQSIDSDSTYRLDISGHGNDLFLNDDVSTIIISGHTNFLTIEEDSLIDSIIISGHDNRIINSSGYKVTKLITIGDRNQVFADSNDSWTDSGENNIRNLENEETEVNLDQ